MHIGDHHVLKKDFGTAEVTVDDILRALQKFTVQAVKGVQRTMKAGPEIAQMPHPTKERRYVNIPGTKAKHGKHDRQYWTQKDGKLSIDSFIQAICLQILKISYTYLCWQRGAHKEAPCLCTEAGQYGQQYEVIHPEGLSTIVVR